jgi:CO dehydrogenase/acetyl-CoA synthase delta subunit
MKKFPNKVIRAAYESAQGKTFTQLTSDMSFRDQKGSRDYNHHALQWLVHHGIMQRTLNRNRWVFEYRIVK